MFLALCFFRCGGIPVLVLGGARPEEFGVDNRILKGHPQPDPTEFLDQHFTGDTQQIFGGESGIRGWLNFEIQLSDDGWIRDINPISTRFCTAGRDSIGERLLEMWQCCHPFSRLIVPIESSAIRRMIGVGPMQPQGGAVALFQFTMTATLEQGNMDGDIRSACHHLVTLDHLQLQAGSPGKVSGRSEKPTKQ